MMRQCLSADELLAHALARLGGVADPAETHHVDTCAACHRRFSTILNVAEREDVDLLIDVLNELTDTSHDLVQKLMDTVPIHRWETTVSDNPLYHSRAALQALLAAASHEFSRRRLNAVALASAATKIPPRLPDVPATAMLAARAWKDLAWYLPFVDRLHDSENALEIADAYARKTGNPHEVAVAKFGRACVYANPAVARFDDATKLLGECQSIFADRDPARFRKTQHLLAVIRWRTNDPAGALPLLGPLLDSAPTDGERAEIQMLFATCYERLGEPIRAIELADAALSYYARENETIEVLKAMWIRADAQFRLGLAHEARATFLTLLPLFQRAGMRDTEVRIELEIARTELAIGGDLKAVRERIVRAYALAVALERTEPSRARTLSSTAVAYLRECDEHGALTNEALNSVLSYLTRVDAGERHMFSPPSPPAIM